MKYTLRYITNRVLYTISRILMHLSIWLEACSPGIKKNISIVRNNFGYTVQIDGVSLDIDVAYAKASELSTHLENLRKESV